MKYIYILVFAFIFSVASLAKATEISDRREKQVGLLDPQKQVESKDKAQSIGNIYTTTKNIYITDTININDMSIGQTINYIKNGQKDCLVTTGDIINVMSYDSDFDSYMKLITYGQDLKLPPGSAGYYAGQAVSCLRIVGCIYRTNKLLDIVNNTAITSSQMSEICNNELPKLYNRFYSNNEKYYYLTRQRIGNEIYINGDETDGAFDILADVRYIGDVMFWGNEDPSKLFIHDLKKLEKESDKLIKEDNASEFQDDGSRVAYDPDNILKQQNNSLTLLAQNADPDPSGTDLLKDPDIKDLLGGEIYQKLADSASGGAKSFIKSYVATINKNNTLQDKPTKQTLRDSNNPVSNASGATGAMSVSNTNDNKRTVSLKECLKACTQAKTAADSNFCRNSCLCGQIPKSGGETSTGGRVGGFTSLMVIRYCAEPVNFTSTYDKKAPETPERKKQTVEGLSIILQDFLQTINNKDLTPRSISRESFDFDIMFAKFWKEFDFSLYVNTSDSTPKGYDAKPELSTQPEKINSDTQNPANPDNKKSQSDVAFYESMKKRIEKNVTFWQNMQKITDNLKNTSQELRKRIDK